MWRTDVGLDASCEAVYDDNKKQEKVESIIYPLLQELCIEMTCAEAPRKRPGDFFLRGGDPESSAKVL